MQWFWLLLLVSFLSGPASSAQVSRSQTTTRSDELRQKQQELQDIQRQLSQYQQQLHQRASQEESLLARLDRFSLRQEVLARRVRTTELELQTTQKRAQELQNAYTYWSQQVQQQRQRLAQRLQQLYKLGRLPYVTLLLSAKDVAELAYKVQYIRRIAAHDRQQMQRYQEGLTRLATAREALKTQRQRILVSQSTLRQQQTALTRERQRKASLLRRVRQEQRLAEEAVVELAQTSKVLTRFITQLRHASERASRATGVVKGRMLWPVNGPVLSSYGRVRHRQLDVYTLQKGVYIGAPMGSAVRVTGAGEVLYADWFKGFGRLLIIGHGADVVSVYGYIAEILVDVGDTVHPHQVVAKVGASSALGEPALYFELRHHTVPQDPLLWLRQRSARLTE